MLLSYRLNELLDKAGLTAADIAIYLNIPTGTVDNYLSGLAIPPTVEIYRISELLELSPLDRCFLYDLAALTELSKPSVPPPPTPMPTNRVWLDDNTISKLSTEGQAWENLLAAAQTDTNSPKLSDQNDKTDTYILAKALVWAKTGVVKYRNEVITALESVIGSENGAGILAIVRNIQGYVLAADLIKLDGELNNNFKFWLSELRHKVFSGAGPSLSIITCHEKRPNNFGTHAGAARVAIALYLNDMIDLAAAAVVFEGWLGNRSAYTGFEFGDLDWQCHPDTPVGINPAGCTKEGYSIDGVLPDDQRRSGGFRWPPPKENYVWEALQGAVVQAELLSRHGFPAWDWSNLAIFRAVDWLYTIANYPPDGDDAWIPWIVNAVYATNFPTTNPTGAGKGFGWADWVYEKH